MPLALSFISQRDASIGTQKSVVFAFFFPLSGLAAGCWGSGLGVEGGWWGFF